MRALGGASVESKKPRAFDRVGLEEAGGADRIRTGV
jgi:hypothetical protein